MNTLPTPPPEKDPVKQNAGRKRYEKLRADPEALAKFEELRNAGRDRWREEAVALMKEKKAKEEKKLQEQQS